MTGKGINTAGQQFIGYKFVEAGNDYRKTLIVP
jgi:hypothetical protein